uniref:Cadherin 24, type 2a n=1 Tax=Neolamprologus brichardi TaxID=32507 RepID=A0A3Q4GD88_NEOBR
RWTSVKLPKAEFGGRCVGDVQPERLRGLSKWVTESEHSQSEPYLLPHSRRRRSWLWNQFFVIEEYRGPEPVLIGRLHTDMDKGDGSTKYMLEGEGVGSVFVIDSKTGNIHVTKSLDREEKDQYRLVATATDRETGRALEPSSEFIIRSPVILTLVCALSLSLRHQKRDSHSTFEEDDVRENIISYDDEGGGEADTAAFDITALQTDPRNKIKRWASGAEPARTETTNPQPLRMEELLNIRLDQVTFDLSQPPYDSLQTYEFEGRDSRAESLSSLESDGEKDEGSVVGGIEELNQKFQRLVEIIRERKREKEGEGETPAPERGKTAETTLSETHKQSEDKGAKLQRWDF